MKGIFLLHMNDDSLLEETEEVDKPRVSLHAITGLATVETMQLTVRIGDQTLGALVDSGSTHSFISAAAACRLHLEPLLHPGLRVTVANGDRVASARICRDVHIFINDEEFITDLFVIPLGGYDMVLGVQWLRTLGPILWDFKQCHMSCWCDNHLVRWQGTAARQSRKVANSIAAQDLLNLLLEEFADVFAAPTGLPPPHRHNHRIHLLLDTAPVAVRPYRYPQLVKDELERQCHDMLQQGIIRPSSSAFSSPVLLVKKHDESWCFCVDYRVLNSKTVCDMFPIPVVDELLDELRGVRFFTKLDLHSGYHQVHMEPTDIEKMAFWTHQSHFEFLVMPFGSPTRRRHSKRS
jgi:hypothetical protein